jgi:saccharopine dehydrogenase-like NADP-dependent oxidoreductase
VLRESGFFGAEPIQVAGAEVRPLELTSRLLFPLWHLEEGEEDLTAMRVIVEGRKGARRVRRTFELLDRYDRATGATSMARTTGYTCTAAVRLLKQGLYRKAGVSPPEFLGREPDCYEFVMADLAKRGVVFRETTVALE